MFLTRSEYDRGVNTFSPEGRLFQVEYAIEAVKLGSTSLAIRTSEGIVFAAEKRIQSKLMVADVIEKISLVDKHIGVAFSGLISDSRTLVDKAQQEARDYWFVYNRRIKVEDVTSSCAKLALQFGDDDAKAAMSRPFGVAMLFGGCDMSGAHLVHLDPSGTYIECHAKAIGAATDGAEHSLKEAFHMSMTLDEAKKTVLTILKQVMEEKITKENVEVATIVPTGPPDYGKFSRLTKDQLQVIIEQL